MFKQLLPLLLGCLSFSCPGQTAANFCEQVTTLQSVVAQKHYQPKAVNDSLSKHVFNLFLQRIDPDKDYFLQSDIALFEADALKLDDYIGAQDCSFIDKYADLLEKRILDTKKLLESIKSEAIDYSGKHSLRYIPNSDYSYYENEENLKNGLKKRLGLRILNKLLDNNEKLAYLKAHFKTLEPEVKAKVIQGELCRLDEFLHKAGGLHTYTQEAFLNAYLKYNDPNSSFFNNTEKLVYENALASSELSFGLITDKNKDGDIIIAHIIPGSAAFKNGNFEEDAIVLSLRSNEKTLETLCISNDDIIAFTNDEAYKTMTFNIKKKNGTILDITLTKSKIKVDDNAIRGYLIGDNSEFGYIKIPSFYTNDESPNGRGLSSDIAKELYKLQKENISGLILDLRFNGGGSMQEAIELSGMFIDRGPLSIIRGNTGDTFTIRDPKRGSFFSKPLVLLVNAYSASASEFFASAMQDYNRAIIVGSQTHGKSSAQLIMPLSETKNLGFCKLTIEAFYRVTGKSHQAMGVTPDVLLPSLYSNFESTENSKAFALQNDSISVVLKHRPLAKLALDTVIQKSKIRVGENLEFQSVQANNKQLFKMILEKGEAYDLTLESLATKNKERTADIQSIFNTNEKKLSSIQNTSSTAELLSYNAEEKNQNDLLIEALSKDIYIKEAEQILIDYINSIH